MHILWFSLVLRCSCTEMMFWWNKEKEKIGELLGNFKCSSDASWMQALILFWKQARICTLYSFVTCNCPKLCPNLSVHKCANIAALDRCIQLFYCNTLVCRHFTFMSPSVHYNRWVLHSTMLALVWKAIDLCWVKSAAHRTEECNGVSVLN